MDVFLGCYTFLRGHGHSWVLRSVNLLSSGHDGTRRNRRAMGRLQTCLRLSCPSSGSSSCTFWRCCCFPLLLSLSTVGWNPPHWNTAHSPQLDSSAAAQVRDVTCGDEDPNQSYLSRASGRSIPGYESILTKKCFGLQTDGYARQRDSGPFNYVSLGHNLSFLFRFWRSRIKDGDRSIRHKISRFTIFEILV